jgi:hypothetical protein
MYFCMFYVEKCHIHNLGLNRIRRSTIYKKWIDKSSEIFHKIKVVYRYIFMYAVDVHFGILCILWKLCIQNKSLRAHTQIYTHTHTHTHYRPGVCHCQTLSHNVVSSTTDLSRIQTHNFSGKCSLYWSKFR